MSIFSKHADVCRAIYGICFAVSLVPCSSKADNETDAGLMAATERIETGLVHLDSMSRSDDGGPDDSTYIFARFRGANLLSSGPIDNAKLLRDGAKEKFQIGSLSFFPEFTAFAGDLNEADYIVTGDFGFRLPIWTTLDVDGRKRECEIERGGKKKEARCASYSFDFQPTFSVNVIPGVTYRDANKDGGSALDWHVDIGAEYHLWLKKPKTGGRPADAAKKQTYADLTVGLGRDYFDMDGTPDGYEDYVSGHARWRVNRELELTATGYYGDIEFDGNSLPGFTADSVAIGIRYGGKENQFATSLSKLFMTRDIGVYASLSYGWHSISGSSAASNDDIEYESLSPTLSIRWPDREYAPPKGDGFGYWSQGFAATCFANPICRFAVFGF